MRKLIGLFAIIAVFVSGCGLFGGGETGGGGELTGITNRPPWDQPTPYGMVVIPAGSFHMGNNDQDINVSNVALNRQITVSAFYMDDTEITNNEYRQFLETAKDTLPAEMAALVYPDTMVWINAGKKGFFLKMLIEDIIKITDGQLADISR
jgi:formylglycine-generating enzyme required for sulfatase activity